MARRRTGGRRAALAAAVVAVLAGCSSSGPSRVVDAHGIETTLLTQLHRQRPTITIQADCPAGIPLKVGATFTCSVSLDGVAVSYAVQIIGVSGVAATIGSRPTEPIIDTDEVAAAVKAKLADQVSGATVTCGTARFLQLAVHATFSCTVSAGGQSATLGATVEDDQGNLAFSGAPAPTGPGPATTAPPGG